MYGLGVELGRSVASQLPSGNVLIATTVEDADWLLRGVLDGAALHERARVFCYWNNRIDENTALITSSYEEPIDDAYITAVIVIKSIIAGACVVRTNLTDVLEHLHHEVPVFVLSPVMHIGAERKLKGEFPPAVAARFRITTFAVDSERHGEIVEPGIGGSVYELLGLGDKHEKNAVWPRLVDERRQRLLHAG